MRRQGFWDDVGSVLRAQQQRAAARLEEGLPVNTTVVSVPLRRDCQTRGGRQRRSCSRGIQVAQGADLPWNLFSGATQPSWWSLLAKLEVGGLIKQCGEQNVEM